MNIAYFITPHGFGHASRAAAIMQALHQRIPDVRFALYTTVPLWLFEDTVSAPLTCHPVACDVGMVQRTPLHPDMDATCRGLDNLLPYSDQLLDTLAEQVSRDDCRVVISDIAAMGIAVAIRAGIASALIENFTWDWIYGHYAADHPRLQRHCHYLRSVYARADRHIQCLPVCDPRPGAVTVSPIGRCARRSRASVRQKLGLAAKATMVLVSMGGVPDDFTFLDNLPPNLDCHLVVPGAGTDTAPRGRVVQLAADSSFYHPDLMRAADVLIGKAGYSTVAEAFYAGTAFGYVSRPAFPEAPSLERFIQKNLTCRPITESQYAAGAWIADIAGLAKAGPKPYRGENGADQAAAVIYEVITGKT